MDYLKSLRLVFILCAATGVAAAADRPNIVLILVDDMPWYGTDVRMDPDLPGSAMAFRKMPNVQRLAEQGMTFQHAYSGAGMCAPSRCCLQTGMTAARHLYSGNGGFGPKTDGTVEYTTKKADARRPLLCPEPQGKLLHFYEWPDKKFLYNLEDDLGEKSNLAAEQPEKAAQMAKELMNQIKAVGGYLPKANPNADPQSQVYDPSNLSAQTDGSDPEAGND